MNLLTVIPLTHQKVAETLSYFTASDIHPGAIVSVPLRSKSIHAVVVESRPAADMKSDLRNAPYEIRKLGNVRASSFFPASFMETCRTLAEHYATNIGAILNALSPEILLENAHKIAPPLVPAHVATDETYAVQGDDEDRMGSWRSLIRQEFARKKSVAIYVPTIEDAKSIHATLLKGIEEYIFILHGKLPKRDIIATWKEISDIAHPVVIIATGSYSLLPRSDIETIIIERENSRGWISPKTPYLDLRRALESFARNNKQSVYLADCMLRMETLERLNKDRISQGSPFKWRSLSTADDMLVDMTRKPEDESGPDGDSKPDEIEDGKSNAGKEEDLKLRTTRKFRAISSELEDLIRKNIEENTHLFIFTVRRGLSTMTVCDDCETVVSCEKCGAPVVLHASKDPLSGNTGGNMSGTNFFMCHRCGTRRSAEEVCSVCGSWRLTPLGIGIELAEEEIRSIFPGIDLLRIDADSAKTDSRISEILEKWRSRPGSILLGTETAMLHLKEKAEHIAVVSMDSLFALPDFRITEKIMYTVIRLRSMASRSILIQTRRPEERVFEYGLKGNLSDFHRSALEERRQFGYPPFRTLVKITIEGKKDPIALLMADIRTNIEPYDLDVFPAFTSAIRGNSIIHGLIKADPDVWPDMELVSKLRALPPNVKVKVDPESLL
jgi:primosomal protein N' (replication factor Y)